MPIRVTCPSGHQLQAPDSKANSTVACPRCKAKFVVPGPSIAAASSAREVATSPARESVSQTPATPMSATTTAAKNKKWTRSWLSQAAGYQADQRQRRTSYWLAASMAALALFTMAPAFFHLNLRQAPAWSNVVLLLALLQMSYAVWFALAPDYSTAWVAMFAFAGLAIIYSAATAITLNAQPNNALILDLGELCRTTGNKPTLWSVAVVLIASLMAYFCGSFSHRWRKSARPANQRG